MPSPDLAALVVLLGGAVELHGRGAEVRALRHERLDVLPTLEDVVHGLRCVFRGIGLVKGQTGQRIDVDDAEEI